VWLLFRPRPQVLDIIIVLDIFMVTVGGVSSLTI
jgi:hypothetical protein